MKDSHQLEMWINAGRYLLIPVLIGLGAGFKWAVDKWTASRNNTFDQLSKLFEVMQKQLEKAELSDKGKHAEIEKLKTYISELEEKSRTARVDLIDLRQSPKLIRNFLKDNNIRDAAIMQTIDELETRIKEIGENLKPAPKN